MPYLIHLGEVGFRWILQTTWQATVLVGLILLAQWLLRRRLAPSWRYGLWLLLVARLLMPVVPRSAFSIFNLAGTHAANSHTDERQPPGVVGPNPDLPVNDFNGTPNTTFAAAKEPRRYSFDDSNPGPGVVIRRNLPSRSDWLKVAGCGWLAGVFFLSSRLFWANVRFRSRIARHRPIADKNVTRLLDECRAKFKLTQPVRIIESAEVESPGVYGLWRKWLLLPAGVFERFSHEELRHTFLHELAHLRRRDLKVNWLTACLQTLHWFNPVIWLAFARMRADRELATDALVLAHVSPTDNVPYGETILKVAVDLAQRAMQPGLVGIAETKSGLQTRLRAISGARTAKYWPWAAVGMAAVVAGTGLTGAKATDQPEAATTPTNSTPGLNRAAKISGRVVDVRGRPVNGAQVAIYRLSPRTSIAGSPLPPSSGLALTAAPTPRIFNPQFGHPVTEFSQASEPWSYCTTDVQGRFYLDDLDRALGIIAVQESGFVWVASNGFSTNMTIKLEPWGRIEGILRHYHEVVTNQPVRAFFAVKEGVPSWGSESGFTAKTDGQGHFSFDFIPPGLFGVNSAGMGERVRVNSGEAAVVELGGRGRPVIGKFKIRRPDGEISPADELKYIFYTTQPDGKGKTEEESKALRKQAVSENTFTNFQSRPVQCAPDGSFRIDEVEQGTYTLFAQTTTNGSWIHGEHLVEIPASDPNMREPLDLGVIEISLSSSSFSARVQPATVRYISGHGQAFWITNNTEKTLSITLTKIEVQVGSEWQIYSQPTEPGPGQFYFMHAGINRGWLAPHEAGYGKLQSQSISLPKDGVWRARVIVQEQLTGKEAVEALAHLPAGVNPAADVTCWGHSREIYSE